MKRLILSTVYMLFCTTGLWAQTLVDGIYYNFDASTQTASVVKGDNKYSGSITIPSTVAYNGTSYRVTSIGSHAFYNCYRLTSVTIPNSVTSLGDGAFSYCSVLTSITIPNSVTSLGNWAFINCTWLTSVTIPNSVTSIGLQAFSGCKGLTSITIPNSVTSIGSYAFENCSGLKSVTIPNSVTSIAVGAFMGCTGLTSIYVAEDNLNYASIDGVLYSKDKKTLIKCPEGKTGSVTIPNSVTSIAVGAFYGCTGLRSMTVEATNPPYYYSSTYNIVSYYNIPLYVPTGSVDAYKAADEWKKFTNIQAIPAKNGFVDGDFVFSDYKKTTLLAYIGKGGHVTIPSSVTSIGDEAFSYCTGLTSVTIPNSVTSIGDWAFDGCTGLTSITIPNSVTSIAVGAFMGCTGLTSIYVAEDNLNYASIDGVLYSKGKKTLIKRPEGKTGSVNIPNSVTSIAVGAFYGCEGLTSITIPNSVTSIGDYAFYECTGLRSMTVEATKPPLCGYLYMPDYNIPLYVPAGSVDAYKAATEWKKFTNIQAIPATGEYMITWKNWDGRVIKTSEVSYGEVPAYDGEKPTRPDEAGYTFTFSGWSPTIAAASQNAEYTANYIQTATEAEKTTIENEGDISITITDNTALFTWPENASADTYTLTITRNDEVFCSLTFDGQGRLINLNFPNLRASAEGYRFTVTGLNSGTDYAYDLKAKNGATTVNEYTGEFRTSGVATAVPEAEESIVETARYDINGRPLNAPTKGVNIVKFSDGSFEKEFVR